MLRLSQSSWNICTLNYSQAQEIELNNEHCTACMVEAYDRSTTYVQIDHMYYLLQQGKNAVYYAFSQITYREKGWGHIWSWNEI